jgi:hypothetical protein
MIRSVPLQHLPDGLQFPPELSHRIAYDAQQRKLAYEGYMSKTHFDKLIHLDKSDEYRRAIEQLFQICEFEVEDTSAGTWQRLVPILVTVAVLATAASSAWFLLR